MKTIHDIAADLGVSARTVSRVINGGPGVKAATRDRVQAYVDELGFVPNSGAQALRTQRLNCVGLTIASPLEEVPLSPRTLSVLFEHLYMLFGRRGDFVTFDFNPERPDRVRDYARGVWQKRYSALVIAGAVSPTDPLLPRVHHSGLPYVALLQSDSCPNAHTAAADFQEATRASAAALFERGHRKVGMLASMAGYQPGLDRRRGLAQAYMDAEESFEERCIRTLPLRPGAVEQAARELFEQQDITAVVDCSGFEDGAALKRAAAATGRRIGADLDIAVWSYTEGQLVLKEAVCHYYVPTVESAILGMQHLHDVYYNGADPACHMVLPGRAYTPGVTEPETASSDPFFNTDAESKTVLRG